MIPEVAPRDGHRLRHEYVCSLKSRLKSSESHLAEINALCELWNHGLAIETTPVTQDVGELLATAAVDIMELQNEIRRVQHQISIEEKLLISTRRA